MGCPRISYPNNDANSLVSNHYGNIRSIADYAVQQAMDLMSDLGHYSYPDMIQANVQQLEGATFTPFEQPGVPESSIPSVSRPDTPSKSALRDLSLEGLDNISAPEFTVGEVPTAFFPDPPTLNEPDAPGAPPSFSDVAIPVYAGDPLPEVPTLETLNIPEPPEVNFDEFEVIRPDFELPDSEGFDNAFISDANSLKDALIKEYVTWDSDGALLREKWAALFDTGTGLPSQIEQAIFDRAVSRSEVEFVQAINQEHEQWAAKGFSLPGSTLLRRTSELQKQLLDEKSRINKEVMIQIHTQELEMLKFAIQQGAALEGQKAQLFVQILGAATAIVSGHYDVAKALYDAKLQFVRAQVEIYQADIAAYREQIQLELNKLEAFRLQIEGERVKGEINQQLVAVYQARMQGVLAGVEVFKARIDGANAQIQAQLGQMQIYRSRLDAYRAEWEGEKIKSETYAVRVNAEEARFRAYQAQVQAFSERVNAFRASVDAEATKINAETTYNNALTDQYRTDASVWETEVNSSISEVRAAVDVFRSKIEAYSAQVTSEQARVTGEARNAEIIFEQARANVLTQLKKADQAIAQLQAAESLGVESLKAAGQTTAQLAASALSAVNMSASISDSRSRQSSTSSSCSENYTFSGDI